jgi:hypothetical protein
MNSNNLIGLWDDRIKLVNQLHHVDYRDLSGESWLQLINISDSMLKNLMQMADNKELVLEDRGLLIYSNASRKSSFPNRFINALQRVRAMRFELKYDELSQYDKKSAYLGNYKVSDVLAMKDKEISSHIMTRAQRECVINGKLRFGNLLLIVMDAMGYEGHTSAFENRWIRRMKYFLGMFKVNGVPVEPFVEGSRGRLDKVATTTLAGPQWLTMLNLAIMEHMFSKLFNLIDIDIIDEVGLFLINNPYENTGKLKSMISPTKNIIGTINNDGYYPKWEGSLKRGDVGATYNIEPVKGTLLDSAVYNANYKNAMEALDTMKKSGLSKLASLIVSLTTAKIDTTFFRTYSWLISCYNVTGWTRGSLIAGLEKQTTYEFPLSGEAFDLPWKDKLYDAGYNTIANTHKNNLIPDSAKYLRHTFMGWTDKSSGGHGVKVSTKLTNSFGKEFSYTWNFTGKASLALFAGESLFTKESVDYRTDAEHPGTIGFRIVPGGKLPRGIFVFSIRQAVLVGLIAYLLEKDQRRGPVSAKLDKDQDWYNEFTAGQGDGPIIRDFLHLLICSSREEFFSLGMDAESFDASLKEYNARRFVRQGMVDACNERSLEGMFGFSSLAALIEQAWGEGYVRDTVYSVKDPITGEVHNFTLDMVLSGEPDTSSLTSLLNKANVDTIISAMKEDNNFKNINVILSEFMGDDSILITERLVETLNNDEYQRFIDLTESISERNGLKINKFKLEAGTWLAAYLKKTFIRGCYLAFVQTQILTTERPEDLPFKDFIMGMEQTLNVVVSRGWDHDFMYRIFHGIFNVRRSVRYEFGKVKGKKHISNNPKDFVNTGKEVNDYEKQLVFYPFASFFIPKKGFSGFGFFPGSLLGSNKDDLLALVIHNSSKLRKVVEETSVILSGTGKRSKVSELVRKINSQHRDNKIVTGKGLTESQTGNLSLHSNDPMYHGRQCIRFKVMSRGRMYAAKKAHDELMQSFNYEVDPKFYYLNMPKEFAQTRLSTTANMVRLNFDEKLSDGLALISGLRSLKDGNTFRSISSEFPFVDMLNYKFVDVIDDIFDRSKDISPFPCLCPSIHNVAYQLGFSPNVDYYRLQPTTLLNKLMDDKFPRYLRSEAIFDKLLNPKIFGNVEAMQLLLISMGASSSAASEVATQLGIEAANFKFTHNLGLSLSDNLIPNINLSEINHSRVVSLFSDSEIDHVIKFIRELFMMFSLIMVPILGDVYHIDVHFNNNVHMQTLFEFFVGASFKLWSCH